MGVKSNITDKGTNKSAIVLDGNMNAEPNSLVVVTRPLKTYTNEVLFFFNDDYGIDMNVNASPDGTPLPVHDGTDTTLWTGTTVSGASTVDFDRAEHPRTGTKSIKVEEELDVVWQFDNGSNLNMALYDSLTIWIYVDKQWKAGDSISIYGWDSSTGSQIGNTLYLEDYFDYLTQKVYQKISIPISDFGSLASSTTMNAFRQRIVAKDGQRAKFFMDDIALEGTGTTAPIEYTVEPENGTWLHVQDFTFSVADAMAGTLLNATMPYLAYDKILGVTLTAGINYKRTQNEVIEFSEIIKNLMNLMELPGTVITGSGSDGTNTWVTVRAVHPEPLLLKAEDLDKLSMTISDNMSGLLHFRVSAGCKIEQR